VAAIFLQLVRLPAVTSNAFALLRENFRERLDSATIFLYAFISKGRYRVLKTIKDHIRRL